MATQRVIRSNIARFKVKKNVAEAVIGHAKESLEGTCNVYENYDDKREAVQAWADKVAQIVADDSI